MSIEHTHNSNSSQIVSNRADPPLASGESFQRTEIGVVGRLAAGLLQQSTVTGRAVQAGRGRLERRFLDAALCDEQILAGSPLPAARLRQLIVARMRHSIFRTCILY